MPKRILINFFTPEDQEPQKDLLYAEVILGFEGTVQEVQDSFHWCDWYVDSVAYEADEIPKRIEVTSVRVLS